MITKKNITRERKKVEKRSLFCVHIDDIYLDCLLLTANEAKWHLYHRWKCLKCYHHLHTRNEREIKLQMSERWFPTKLKPQIKVREYILISLLLHIFRDLNLILIHLNRKTVVYKNSYICLFTIFMCFYFIFPWISKNKKKPHAVS